MLSASSRRVSASLRIRSATTGAGGVDGVLGRGPAGLPGSSIVGRDPSEVMTGLHDRALKLRMLPDQGSLGAAGGLLSGAEAWAGAFRCELCRPEADDSDLMRTQTRVAIVSAGLRLGLPLGHVQ